MAKPEGLLTMNDWLFLSVMLESTFTYLPNKSSYGVLSTAFWWSVLYLFGTQIAVDGPQFG